MKRALLCLLQNLGGHVPPVPPGSYVYENIRPEVLKVQTELFLIFIYSKLLNKIKTARLMII